MVKKATRLKAPVCHFLELELCLGSVKTELFNLDNIRPIPDNLSLGKRCAFCALTDIDRIKIKRQDKGSKFVVIDPEEYNAKMKEQLQNLLHYEKLDSDPSSVHVDFMRDKSGMTLFSG